MDRAIVVIEDEPLLRQYAIETFAAAGLTVVDFEDGDRALAYVQANPAAVEAVFTDVRLMGATDGLRIARAITETHPDITVVVTSGGFAERPAELGPRVVYIGKPWMAIDVLNAIIDAKQDD
ncbi:response regulator [Lichenibacterium dinghuense]|uniref:response regulator n=1 Tax=Lichenibacterium dinghuense TaxID=2895977 RepID=UPI001F026D71|nr:response regulator [Lichenibacterium sp. 6Y81]